MKGKKCLLHLLQFLLTIVRRERNPFVSQSTYTGFVNHVSLFIPNVLVRTGAGLFPP
jgi:hypothetical protein